MPVGGAVHSINSERETVLGRRPYVLGQTGTLGMSLPIEIVPLLREPLLLLHLGQCFSDCGLAHTKLARNNCQLDACPECRADRVKLSGRERSRAKIR